MSKKENSEGNGIVILLILGGLLYLAFKGYGWYSDYSTEQYFKKNKEIILAEIDNYIAKKNFYKAESLRDKYVEVDDVAIIQITKKIKEAKRKDKEQKHDLLKRLIKANGFTCDTIEDVYKTGENTYKVWCVGVNPSYKIEPYGNFWKVTAKYYK